MSDDIPDFPPGPRGPEDPEPGPRLGFSAEQARYIGLYVREVDGASSVEIEDRGAGYFKLTIFDKEGVAIDEKRVHPHANRLRGGGLA
jgi:hypothetical protein